MATTKKNTNTKAPKKETKKVETKAVETPVVEEKKEVETEKKEKAPKVKKEKKVAITVPQMNNSELKELFTENGCKATGAPKDTSNVVYNTFGTASRVLQQNKAYQLLLTNGKLKMKKEVVDAPYNDVDRFKKFYEELTDEEKKSVSGFDTMESTKLADSEFPREKTVKIISKEILVKFIRFMATFEENQVVVAK
jgi:hypothetical protein